jgi:hypothetical protein
LKWKKEKKMNAHEAKNGFEEIMPKSPGIFGYQVAYKIEILRH